jgi:DeoR/GlpR family transcriptional regulator of sugar metabolism
MLPAERLQNILYYIIEHSFSSITELSERFDVSPMTIRRDLKQLEDQGFIRRTRGGALAPEDMEPRYVAKQTLQTEAKQLIARYVAERFVSDNDVLILEGGTTVTMMAPFLSAYRNLTIVTNGLFTLNELRGLLPKHTIISTGGILRDVSFTFVGPTTEAFFERFHANKVFLSATGWDAAAGFTDPNMLETSVKRAMLQAAESPILLIDSSKFGVKSLSTFMHSRPSTPLVTDGHVPPSVLEQLIAHKFDVHVVPYP